VISERLLSIVRCPECRGLLTSTDGALVCRTCRATYRHAGDYLDLRPKAAFAEQTKYLDDALHADARHERVSPPLLGAGVRNNMLRALLDPRPDDRILDLGCGSGRALVWNRASGAWTVGVDITPHFAGEARAGADLLLGDLRRLPFADGTFNKAYSLDVVEHLSPEALAAMLTEAARVLQPGGSLFVYSHVRKNSRLALGLRGINRLARGLERVGLIDLTQERLRKSDHVNPLADVPHLEKTVAAAGFRIARIRYYTPLVGALIENVLMRVAEKAWMMGLTASAKATAVRPIFMRRRKARPAKWGAAVPGTPAKEARRGAKARIERRGPLYALLRALTWVMHLDLVLFGGVRSGPFFALLRRE
jgi:SAM-dependent methyltransferase